MVGVSRPTVYKYKWRYERRLTLNRTAGSGRPRITTSRQDRAMAHASEEDKYLTAVEMRNQMKDFTPHLPSVWTIRRRLVEAGLPGRRPAVKPLLNRAQKRARREWAKKHLSWTEDAWEHVLWSDETPVPLFTNTRPLWIHRRKGQRLSPDGVARTVKGGGGKIQVWGCFHANGVGPLKRINEIMDGKIYHGILVTHAVPKMRELIRTSPQGTRWTFQHDNDPKHTAKKNRRYLDSKTIGELKQSMSIMEWPSQSPDLNPIENVWRFLKLRLSRRVPRPSNLNQLFEAVKEEWKKLPTLFLKHLARGMPRRVQAVLKAHGDSIKY
jgi:transposase